MAGGSNPMYYRVLIFLCLAISSVSFGFCQTNSDGIVDSQNRLAIIIDTTRPENSSRYKKALDSLIQTLNNTGINMSRIIVYSNICKQNEFKPTSTNIRALMNTIRNRNLKKLKNNNGNNITIRPNIDKLAELQIYLIAGGITNESQTRFMIIPSDVDEKNIKSTYDENLISIQNEIVDAMSDNAKANLFERTLLVINVNSVISVTRSSNHYSGASSKDINISYMSKTLKVHSNTGEENEEFEEDAKPRNFRSMLIIPKIKVFPEPQLKTFSAFSNTASKVMPISPVIRTESFKM